MDEAEPASLTFTRRLTYRTGGAITRDERVGGSTYDYVYNARGRMTSASKDSVLAGEYGYDAFGRRVWRETHGAGAVHIHYIFDPDGHLLAEHDAATGDVLREYVWLEDMPLAMFDYSGGSPATFFIHTGQIGEPLAVTNAAKAKVWDAAIEPFGQAVMFATASEALDLRLPGQWAQAETGGLFQNWMRDYDPTLGRYAQADPLGIEAGENLYGYALASPLSNSDWTGRASFPSAMLGSAGRRFPAVGAIGATAQLARVAIGASKLFSEPWGVPPDDPHKKRHCPRPRSSAPPMPPQPDFCLAEYMRDSGWCDVKYARGSRVHQACHSWAGEELARCRNGQRRQPFRL